MKDKEKQICKHFDEEVCSKLDCKKDCKYYGKANCHNCIHEEICQLRTFSYCEEEVKEKGCEHYQQKFSEDSVVYKDGKIYYNDEHIGYLEFSFYEDIKALGFGNFEIIDKRKGYGTLVIKDIITKYKDKYDLIYCFVEVENIGAIEFYKKVGKVCFDIINDKNQYQVILYEKEDSIVLSREELKEKYVSKSFYELAKKVHEEKVEELENLIEYWIENWKQSSKETAEKILKEINLRLVQQCPLVLTDKYCGYEINKVSKLLKEIATREGVEIKE